MRPSHVLVVAVSIVLARASGTGDEAREVDRSAPQCVPAAPAPPRAAAPVPGDTDAHGRVVLVCVEGAPCREVSR